MASPLLVGITGGIGAGKSTVCKVFELLSVPVLIADVVAKNIVQNNVEVKEQIISCFGPSAYVEGVYNKEFVSAEVFNNQEKLSALNAIIHPAVHNHTRQWLALQNSPYCLYEAALISPVHKGTLLNKVLLVTAPMPVRIARIQARDHKSIQQIESIISKQQSDEMFRTFADFEIQNDESQLVIPQVLAIHQMLSA